MTTPAGTTAAASHLELRRGGYQDSVRLMQVGQAVAAVPGVRHALVAMATGLNLSLATRLGFRPPEDATGNDLLIAVTSDGAASLREALARLELELAPQAMPEHGATTTVPPRTVGSAIRRTGATLAVVSTPGEHAFAEAMDAVQAGSSVMVFSDNMPLWQELRLKDAATAAGVLVMGPDCGTAVVSGVGLGFANVVRPGPVGLVAASGTGAQQVMCLLDAAGVGVSHCLGVGGRDLSTEVAGRSTLAAMDALDADPATELILLVSKPPAPEVAELIQRHSGGLATPVVLALLGPGQPDLTAAVTRVLGLLGRPAPGPWPVWLPADPHTGTAGPHTGPAGSAPGSPGRALRGIFAGGTLADEAMLIAAETLGPIRSNIPLHPGWALPPGADPLADGPLTDGHWVVDFGADELTRGRPHPMIDATLRLRRLAQETADPACGVVLLDVVLGHAADPDPAASLVPAVTAAVVAGVAVVVSLIGTDSDPQGLTRQAEALRAAGASVFGSNAGAARHAVSLAGDPAPAAPSRPTGTIGTIGTIGRGTT